MNVLDKAINELQTAKNKAFSMQQSGKSISEDLYYNDLAHKLQKEVDMLIAIKTNTFTYTFPYYN